MPVDPQTEAFLRQLAEEEAPPITEQTPEMAREAYRALAEILGPGPAVERVDDRAIPGPGGAIPLRVYRPPGEGPFGALVYFHGGGWVLGDLETHDHLCRSLCNEGGCVVAAVDYRRAPEHRCPAAAEDAWAALGWVAEHAAELDVDPRRLGVGGDSAGGNLTAVVTQRARDAGAPALVFQLLLYPTADLRLGHPSMEENADGYLLTRDHMRWFRSHYLGAEIPYEDPRASPLLAASHAGLPPALVVVAGFDPLRDEGEAYAERLRAAGVPVTLRRWEGTVHLFVQLWPLLDAGREALGQVGAALRSALG